MQDWIEGLMNYPGIAFLMFLENVFPPIPSELVMPLAGFQAAKETITLWGAILAGLIGSVIGQLPLYYLGKVVGEERLAAWADKHGAWLTLSGDDIHKSKQWFDKHGSKAVIFARLVPGIRSLISVPAGMADMNLPKFLLYSAIGTGTWAAGLAFIGYKLGDRYEEVEKFIGPATYVILGAIVLYIIVNVIKRKHTNGKGNGNGQAQTPAAS